MKFNFGVLLVVLLLQVCYTTSAPSTVAGDGNLQTLDDNGQSNYYRSISKSIENMATVYKNWQRLVDTVVTGMDKEKHFTEEDHELLKQTTDIVEESTNGATAGSGWEWLADFADKFGHRLVGSESLENAIDYIIAGLKESGFDNVHTEYVHDLPKWTRGTADVSIIQPRMKNLTVLSTGLSPGGDVTAEVIVFDSLDHMNETDSSKIEGKIVLFNFEWTYYGENVKYRYGADAVAAKSGVAMLIRSLASHSINSPHTGKGAAASIQSICITVEDAEMIARMAARGEVVTVRVASTSETMGVTTSRNTIFEITGSEFPEEIIVIGGHLDSWDVGQGAMDNGGGCAVVWQALSTIKNLGLRPKRTIRVVLFTAEEWGYLGAIEYYEAHKNDSIIFVGESDFGAFRPESFNATLHFAGTPQEQWALNRTLTMIHLNKIPISSEASAPKGDIQSWTSRGVPGIYYDNKDSNDKYMSFHHSEGDMMSVLDKADIDQTAAIFASIAYQVAQNGVK